MPTIQAWLKDVTDQDFIMCPELGLDLYNETFNLGIEYCTLLQHNEHSAVPKSRTYHNDKYLQCVKKGIHLITIFEDEWVNRQKQVQGALLSILGKSSRRFYARKCEVKLIDKAIGNKFYDENHIQGKSTLSFIYAGLYFNDELLGVMSFGKHHRDTTKFVLDRLCFKYDVSIAGGSSRLFKFLLNNCEVTELISWSDNRWFSGGVYPNLGFTLETELGPDYSYVDVNSEECKRISKQSQKKGNTSCPSDLTERQWCMQRGLYRIWDCGKKRWKFVKS